MANEQFAAVHLWAAMGDVPEIYGLKAARGALRALSDAVDRAERGEPPLAVASPVEKRVALREALPTLCVECPLTI